MRISPLTLSALLWLAFIVYWSRAARRAAPSIGGESVRSRQVHVLLMYGALFCTLALRVPPFDRGWIGPSPILVGLGFAVQLAGFALAAWARRHLGRNWSGAVATQEGHQLVRSGPYRLVRHPIYAAMLLMFVGPALISGAWHGLVGLALIAYAYRRKIAIEEARLRDVFGEAYADYARHSWALVPGVL